MMIRVIIFNAFYITTCLYALVRGGAAERAGVVILIANFQLSHWLISPLPDRYGQTEWGMFAVDGGTFFALFGVALISNRFWPLWMTAVQGVVAFSHFASFRADIIPIAYGNAVALWSYVLLAMLGVATRRHQRRLGRFGFDPSWVWQDPAAYFAARRSDEARAARTASERASAR